MFTILLLFLVGCSKDEANSLEVSADEENSSNEEAIDPMYDNPYFEVSQVDEWVVEEQKSTEKEGVFVNNSSVAIVSKLDENKKETWKNQVMASFSNNAEITEEMENYFAVETKRKENIRGDVYKLEGSSHDVLVIIMTPEKAYAETKETIQNFKHYITLK